MVLSAIVDASERGGGRVESLGENAVELTFGSRSGYRIWGMWPPVSMRPIRLHVTVESDSTTTSLISAEAKSDQGWYVVDVTFLSSRQYKKAFSRLFDILHAGVPPSPTV